MQKIQTDMPYIFIFQSFEKYFTLLYIPMAFDSICDLFAFDLFFFVVFKRKEEIRSDFNQKQ
jgi:hypothetical protein